MNDTEPDRPADIRARRRELGAGFAFVGRQVHFDVDGDDFYVDLLFFHTDQLRDAVIELTTGELEFAFAGRLGLHVAVVDDGIRREFPRLTVVILICVSRDEHAALYALGQASAPTAVSTHSYETHPVTEQGEPPSAERIIAARDRDDDVTECPPLRKVPPPRVPRKRAADRRPASSMLRLSPATPHGQGRSAGTALRAFA